jgi:hypothetical protein
MKNETEVTIAHIALSRDKNMSIGENRKDIRKETKLVALKVRSVETEGFFIELVEEIALGNFSIVGITHVLVAESDASVPSLAEPEGLEINRHPVQSLGIVRTRDKKLMLAVIGDKEVTLPPDTELVGVALAPTGTFHVSAYDDSTLENFKLGYHINGTPSPNWVALALARREKTLNERRREEREKEGKRRQASERAAQEAAAAQMRREAEAIPGEMFTTKDREVAAQLRAAYRLQIVQSKRAKDANGQVVFRIEDPEGHGPGIAAAVATKRKELAAQHEDADAWFERQRREADEVLSAR